MNSLLKIGSVTRKKKQLLKDSLQTHLDTSILEVKSTYGLDKGGTIGNCDESTTLCSVLEAIFLHGLKNSLLNRVTQILTGPDSRAMPQPSFWGPLLVFSHQQMIKQIQSLSQLTTEIGYCRAWIRQSLNDCMLANYLCYIKRDNSALKPYYDHWAYIRDPNLVEVAQRLIETLDDVKFELACNSSLLNSWSNLPLLLAGIWSPPMKSCPIVDAVDVAKTIADEPIENADEGETTSSSSIGIESFNSSQSLFHNINDIVEDGVLKIILANDRADTILCELSNNFNGSDATDENVAQKSSNNLTDTVSADNAVAKDPLQSSGVETPEDKVVNGSTTEDASKDKDTATATAGNSLIGKVGWSTSLDDSQSPVTSSVISESENVNVCTFNENSSYEALIKSYQSTHSTPSKVHEFMNEYSRKIIVEKKSKAESKVVINFDVQLCNIPREKGLDVQNYTCFDCSNQIGMSFSKAHVCMFSARYFCSDCMAEKQYIVPSRMIHNWDLKLYPVSRGAAEFLEKVPSPLMNLKIMNPNIYAIVDIVGHLQSLRIQLNLLRAYLFTCREPIIESLQQKVTPRTYLYEHVHQYSVKDLLDIPNGILAQQLQKIVQFARDHVMTCWLCKQKGFICEVCENPKAIYPFDIMSTFRCEQCNAVYHAECLNNKQPCPKCVRKRNRLDLPLLNIGCADLQENMASSSPERIETK